MFCLCTVFSWRSRKNNGIIVISHSIVFWTKKNTYSIFIWPAEQSESWTQIQITPFQQIMLIVLHAIQQLICLLWCNLSWASDTLSVSPFQQVEDEFSSTVVLFKFTQDMSAGRFKVPYISTFLPPVGSIDYSFSSGRKQKIESQCAEDSSSQKQNIPELKKNNKKEKMWVLGC